MHGHGLADEDNLKHLSLLFKIINNNNNNNYKLPGVYCLPWRVVCLGVTTILRQSKWHIGGSAVHGIGKQVITEVSIGQTGLEQWGNILDVPKCILLYTGGHRTGSRGVLVTHRLPLNKRSIGLIFRSGLQIGDLKMNCFMIEMSFILILTHGHRGMRTGHMWPNMWPGLSYSSSKHMGESGDGCAGASAYESTE